MDDALDVLAWRNDPDSVAVSKSQKPVDRAEHLPWFANAIKSPDHVVLIAEEDGRKLGTVRFDRKTESWLVSINLAPEERDRRLGRPILTEAIAMHCAAAGPCRLIAEIQEDNPKSLHLFERAGFVRHAVHDGFHYLSRE